jgi:hypothetical protein
MQLSPNLSLFSLSVQFASCSSLVKVSVDLTIRAVLDVPSESQTSIRPSHHCSEKVVPWQLFFLMRGVEACAPAFSLSLSLSLTLKLMQGMAMCKGQTTICFYQVNLFFSVDDDDDGCCG